MWSFVGGKTQPQWLWGALDHRTGRILAYVFGRREDQAFLKLKALLEPFGIRRFYTDGWGAAATLFASTTSGCGAGDPCRPYRHSLDVATQQAWQGCPPLGHYPTRRSPNC